MVDSTPTADGPPSSTSGTASPSPLRTCAARLGLIRPKRLADGAASPVMPTGASACISCANTGCDDTRSAMVSCPALAKGGASGRRGSTSVSGPGQKAAASRWACGDQTAQRAAAPALATCTISG